MIRIPRLPSSSWLLIGATVVCAAGALAVTLGFGRKISTLPDDAALAAPLPRLRLRQPLPRLAPGRDYAEIAQRPLFSQSRRPTPIEPPGAVEPPPPELDYTLTSVIITADVKLAILHDKDNRPTRARLNDSVETAPGWKLVELRPRQAVFEGGGVRKTLDLRVFDGQGGGAPTLVHQAPQAMPAPTLVHPPSQSTPAPSVVHPVQREAAVARPAPLNKEPTPLSEEQRAASIRQRIEARREALRRKAKQR